MPTYKSSSNERFEKSVIKSRTDKAKKKYSENMIDEYGFRFCERTKRSDLPLDHSHIVSVKYAQEIGKCELAWCQDNFELLSRQPHRNIEDWPNQKRLAWYYARKEGIKFNDFLKDYE